MSAGSLEVCMRRFVLVTSFAGTTLLAATLAVAPLGAQAFKGRGNDGVPEGYRPPPGMCRIWIDGVPPGQQPAPTDCATAVRNRPANGRVIFGDDAAKTGKGKPRKFRGVGYSGSDDGREVAREARRDDRRSERQRERDDRERAERVQREERSDDDDDRSDDDDRRRTSRRTPD